MKIILRGPARAGYEKVGTRFFQKSRVSSYRTQSPFMILGRDSTQNHCERERDAKKWHCFSLNSRSKL